MSDTSNPKNPFLVTPFHIGSQQSGDETKRRESPAPDQDQVLVPREVIEKWQEILKSAQQLKTRYDKLRAGLQGLADRLKAREEKTQSRGRRLASERLLFLVGQLKQSGWRPKSRRLEILAEMETLLAEAQVPDPKSDSDRDATPLKAE